jgi:cytochrome b involved in lipid metabolism
MRAITKAELRQHSSVHDAWSVYRGRVYNITPFLHYHPGGVEELMKGAGKDCTALFNKYHAWVNADGMIGSLCLGWIVDDAAEGEIPISTSTTSTSSEPTVDEGKATNAMMPPPSLDYS